jgi:hypothetical protein
MPYLITAVVLVGVLGLVNLALTAAVMRRLRSLAERSPARSPAPGMLAPGSTVAPFTGVTVDGSPVTLDGLATPALIAFLAPGCRPCEDLLPELVTRAGRHPAGALAVITAADPGEATGYRHRLDGTAHVVVEDVDGALNRAFSVSAYPTVYLVDGDGRVLAAGSSFAGLDATDTSVRA